MTEQIVGSSKTDEICFINNDQNNLKQNQQTLFMEKHLSLIKFLKRALFISPVVLFFGLAVFSSFTLNKLGDDFLKQLGITKDAANQKISGSLFSGSISSYGVKNAKNIALGNRKAVALELLNYTKNYINSPSFVKEYATLRTNNKPKESTVQTPDEMKTENIANQKQFVADAEATLKKNTNPSLKSIFEQNLVDSKQRLKEAQDPNNKQYVIYARNYPQLVKDIKASNDRAIAEWNNKYPENQLVYVSKRLQEFMEVTKDVDFNAELIEKNKKKVFVNPVYEHKDYRWKMAFRAGREVVEPSREFVEKWIAELQ
jgi:hypothetical protein